jgi:hypothetical protein
MEEASNPWDETTYIYAGPNSKAKESGGRWALNKQRLLVKSDRFEKTNMGNAIKTGRGVWATVYLGNVLHLEKPEVHNFRTLNEKGYDSIEYQGDYFVFSMEQVYPDEVSGQCVICIEKTSQVVIIPCGHMCLCEGCAEECTGACPICRADFTGKIRVYIT